MVSGLVIFWVFWVCGSACSALVQGKLIAHVSGLQCDLIEYISNQYQGYEKYMHIARVTKNTYYQG